MSPRVRICGYFMVSRLGSTAIAIDVPHFPYDNSLSAIDNISCTLFDKLNDLLGIYESHVQLE